jgi:tRNA modification GTPase
MHTEHEDTIAAIATPLGRAALGIVRISGKDCRSLLRNIFSPIHKEEIRPFCPIVGKVSLKDGSFLDEVVLTLFERPHSYTREDVAEISCHGNPLILEMLLKRVIEAGARLANAGEFTYRAFLNGRLDLVQAEAVKDLIEAESQHQAELALNHLHGRLSILLQELKTQFIDLIALMEGNIDFSEEQHYDFINRDESLRRHDLLLQNIRNLIGTFEQGRLIRDGLNVAIAGRPNVGKSCLFNALLQQDRAIVTATAGTTRDYLKERISLGGYILNLIDTAGIRESNEQIEEEGIRRSRQIIENADVILFLLDASEPLQKEDSEIWNTLKGRNAVLLCNKMDVKNAWCHKMDGNLGLRISAQTGLGLDELLKELQKCIHDLVRNKKEDTVISSVRHRDLLRQAEESLGRSKSGIEQGLSEEFPLLDLHDALRKIGEITGEVTIEDIYSHIFSNFCIGK